MILEPDDDDSPFDEDNYKDRIYLEEMNIDGQEEEYSEGLVLVQSEVLLIP